MVIHGMDLRAWSAARPEIQRVYLASLDFMHTAEDGTEQQTPRVNALDLAVQLCNTYTAKPASKVIGSVDDEEHCMKRVSAVMTSNQRDIVVPLQSYLQENIKLPTIMHSVVRSIIQERLAALTAN